MRTVMIALLGLAACGGSEPQPAPKPAAPKPEAKPAPEVKPEPKEPAKPFAEMTDEEKHAYLMKTGEEVYLKSTLACTTCHGPEGKGTAGAFPPLVGTKDHMGDCVNHAAIVIYGMQGEIEVDGVKYNGNMTPQGAMLDDNQIAAVITYERNSWGNDFGDCTPDDVKKAREKDPRK
mgnify:CR=1 FL=1